VSTDSRHAARRSKRATDAIAFIARHIFALLALFSVAIFGVVGASAATLGGLQTNDLGAAVGTVAGHTSGLTVTWGARWSGSATVLDSLTITSAAAEPFVVGERVEAVVINSAGTGLCAVAATVATAGPTVAFSRTAIETACGVTPFAYSAIDRVAVTTSGTVAP
jgi:hypothetical protein